MAHLSKRTTRVQAHGGAGPFHAPQRPGRVNNVTASRKLIGLAGVPGQGVLADLRADRRRQAVREDQLARMHEHRRSIFRRVVDRFSRKAA